MKYAVMFQSTDGITEHLCSVDTRDAAQYVIDCNIKDFPELTGMYYIEVEN